MAVSDQPRPAPSLQDVRSARGRLERGAEIRRHAAEDEAIGDPRVIADHAHDTVNQRRVRRLVRHDPQPAVVVR